MAPKRSSQKAISPIEGYNSIFSQLSELIESARRVSARSVNAVMTATYWEIWRRIVESEQRGRKRAGYGEALLERLAADLTAKFGRGYGVRNLWLMRRFFVHWPEDQILQTVSAESQSVPQGRIKTSEIVQTSSAESSFKQLKPLVRYFPLPWSHYVRLMALRSEEARRFYETEALRCGWSVHQLDRQISSQFYERTALSRNKVSMLKKAAKAEPVDWLTPEEEIKDPFVLASLS